MEQAQRLPSFAETYERVLVPGKFAPWARDLVERARPIGPSDRILDLGCGTGIVARVLRERLGGGARITGADVNAQMIAHARTLAPEIDFHEANVMSLPFEDGAFDLVLCQEMLQFAPDRAAALREIHRVLAPGGRLIASTWRSSDEQPLFGALCRIAEQHLGKSGDKRFSFGDGVQLAVLLAEAGFADVRVETVTLVEHHPEVPVRLNALAMNFDLGALTEAEREQRLAAIEADSAPILARFAVDGGYSEAATANVATARRA